MTNARVGDQNQAPTRPTSQKKKNSQHLTLYTVELSCAYGQKEPGLFVVLAAKICKGFLQYDVLFEAVTLFGFCPPIH